MKTNTDTNVIDFTSAKAVKEFIETASHRIYDLEATLYDILECSRLDVAKEMAADVLEEDIDVYLEEDNCAELDFEPEEDKDELPW